MAIEDAAALAAEFTSKPEDIAEALRRYEGARRVRTAKVQRASLALGRVYHYSGALRWARNAMIQRMAPDKLIERYDWIYGSATPT
jgi:salicylate hydroxylase